MKPKRLSINAKKTFYSLLIPILLLLLMFIIFGISSHKVLALPEYSDRTGESCAACHVNPGGGGPRTLRGLLWAARGRPDEIPELPGVLLAPGVTYEVELYEIGCAGCHGYQAEGLSAMGLANTGISYRAMETFTLNGIPALGMPGFEGQFTDEQMDTLIQYVTDLSNGVKQPVEDSFTLPPVLFRCPDDTQDPVCTGPAPEAGGN